MKVKQKYLVVAAGEGVVVMVMVMVVDRADVVEQKDEKVLVPGVVRVEGQGVGESVVQVEDGVVAPVSGQEEAQARWQRGASMAW